jgi:NADH-quinone oxidoreductase subunit F
LNLAEFYSHESCGQCTPCREGSDWVRLLIKSFLDGNARASDADVIKDVCSKMDGTTICPLAEALVWPVESFIEKFRPEFEALAAQKASA